MLPRCVNMLNWSNDRLIELLECANEHVQFIALQYKGISPVVCSGNAGMAGILPTVSHTFTISPHT